MIDEAESRSETIFELCGAAGKTQESERGGYARDAMLTLSEEFSACLNPQTALLLI